MSNAKSREELFNEMKQKAEQGNKDAQFLVGEKCWYDGQISDAMYFLRKSATQNQSDAQLLLAKILYKQGNDDEAMHWLCCAHLNGLAEAANLMNEHIEFYEGRSEYGGKIQYDKYQNHIALVQRLGIDYSVISEEKEKQNKKVLYITLAVTAIIVLFIINAVL